MDDKMLIKEKMAVLVGYFLSAVERASAVADLTTLKEKVLGMTLEEFGCVYHSLEPEEMVAFDEEREWSDLEELSRYMIFTKTLNRYYDAKAGHTWMDDEGILHITVDSCVLEMRIDLTTYNELCNLGAYSISQMRDLVTKMELSAHALQDISAATVMFIEDATVSMEG